MLYLPKVSGGYFPTMPVCSAGLYSTKEIDLSMMGLQYDSWLT